MIDLHPHQRELLQILESPERSRFGVIESYPGAGIGRVLELYVAKIGVASRVLVLCSMRVLVEQWAEQLGADENLQVTVLDSAHSSLDLLDGGEASSGVLITTYARVRRGLTGRALAELDYRLILLDHPQLPFPEEVSRLNSRTQEEIALLPRRREGGKALNWPTLWTVTPEQIIPTNRLVSIQIPVQSTPQERALRDDIASLLREIAVRSGKPFSLPSDSFPTLHARLLEVASDSLEPSKFTKRAWQLLDRMEGSFAKDSRLVALDKFLSTVTGEGRRCVVVTATSIDAKYIADHCTSTFAVMPRGLPRPGG
jgi:hypothetical protein